MENSTKTMINPQKVETHPRQQEDYVFLDVPAILKIFSKMKIFPTDIIILKKFYMTKLKPPFDTKTWCFPILYKELVDRHDEKTCSNNIHNKLRKFVRNGLLKRIRRTNPSVYEPIDEIKYVVRSAIVLWLARRELKML